MKSSQPITLVGRKPPLTKDDEAGNREGPGLVIATPGQSSLVGIALNARTNFQNRHKSGWMFRRAFPPVNHAMTWTVRSSRMRAICAFFEMLTAHFIGQISPMSLHD